MTDQEFLQGIIRRDEAVFRALADRYQQHVIRTCYALVRDEQDARDLAQEVFIEVLESARWFRKEAQLSTWIYRIAVNKSLNHLKQQKRRQILTRLGFRSDDEKRIEDPHPRIPSDNRADSNLQEKETKQALHTAIGKLPVNQQIAFSMHTYEELPYKEIAAVMQVSLASVESLIHRARQNLRKSLTDFYEGKR